MTAPKIRIITTGDGSHSLQRDDINETYHSFHGAIGESEYVYIDAGLMYFCSLTGKTSVKILEVGFGTGLNAWLTAKYAAINQLNIDYHTLEPIPIESEIYEKLNYGDDDESKLMFQKLHQCGWESPNTISDFFKITKYETTLEEYEDNNGYDVIYFDAFAPSKQPEIWAEANINKCSALLNRGGVLVTYCAQGQFKRSLKASGLLMETLPGAMGKKEMVRGQKPI